MTVYLCLNYRAELNSYFFVVVLKKQAVFLNCKLGLFQLAQKKSVLGVALAPGFVVVFVLKLFCSPSYQGKLRKLKDTQNDCT